MKMKKHAVLCIFLLINLSACYKTPPEKKTKVTNQAFENFSRQFGIMALPLLNEDLYRLDKTQKIISAIDAKQYKLSTTNDTLYAAGKIIDSKKFVGLIVREQMSNGQQFRLTTFAKDGKKISELVLAKQLFGEGISEQRAEIGNNYTINLTRLKSIHNDSIILRTKMEYLLGDNGVIGFIKSKQDTMPLIY